MTDRELLEAAAKAAGLSGRGTWDDKWGCLTDYECWTFDPLEDDGDALRLAVELSIFTTPEFYHYKSLSLFGTRDHDPCAATRRAIVRAAAEIGKGL